MNYLTSFGCVVMALTLAASFAAPLSAHHSFAAEYDSNKPVNVQGAVNVGSTIRTKKPGDSVTIEYFRGDERRTATATHGVRPSN